MTVKFTELSDKLKYPPVYRAKLSVIHSSVVSYVMQHFEYGYSFRKKVIDAINTLSYMIISGDTIPTDWSIQDPLNNLPVVDEDVCRSTIGDLFLHDKQIEWNLEAQIVPTVTPKSVPVQKEVVSTTKVYNTRPTDKSDLYIKPPTVPQFDTSRIWAQGTVNNTDYVIYTSLPDIPKKQNEISVTTDVSKMTHQDLMNLYPNQFIRTRSACMYDSYASLKSHHQLGVVFPISNYSERDIIDNIVKYPHIFRLLKVVDSEISSFYNTIEIDGQLYSTLEIWDDLPESSVIPKTSDFLKEYVVRRYLLERDIDKIEHKYPMFGTLDPFLTLFTTPEEYISLGYEDVHDIAKRCVESRVSYKQSRNPVIRRLNDA